jgi:N6-L-threonylcarbamoyladenine synthase
MLILGIESSCDETAASIVRDGSEVLSSVIASQAALHAKTGGVVPEVAAREHVGNILPVIEKALAEAKVSFAEVDAIAVAAGPGLASSLLAGVITANTLATFLDKPLIPVNHIYGHIRANWLGRDSAEFSYPILTLTASGGHNELVLLHSDGSIELVGESTDDAAGEAFDKVARLIGLGYPGGPVIEKTAKLAKAKDSPEFLLPRAWLLPKDISRNFDSREVGKRLRNNKLTLTNFDFSFSGLKSEVRRRVVAQKRLTADFRANLAYGFQEAVIDILATKTLLAARKFFAQEIHLAGGVSANSALRERIQTYADELQIPFRCPTRFQFCTDNAAMIAAAGFALYKKSPHKFAKLRFTEVNPNLPLV